ncbi:hypothetical protein GCM10010321_39140 [Streptomyces chartreusis]|nr:hypothetical protein GCM10010321_39140 [Streptomyces chartreusis]
MARGRWPGTPSPPARRARRQREQCYLELVASLRLACAVLNPHGPAEADAAAVELLAACEETVTGVHQRFLESFYPWSRDWAVREVARIREARQQFPRMAGPHLNSV